MKLLIEISAFVLLVFKAYVGSKLCKSMRLPKTFNQVGTYYKSVKLIMRYTFILPFLSLLLFSNCKKSQITEIINNMQICVFDNRNWVPVYYGNINGCKVTFKSMGRGIVYVSALYDNGQIVPFGNPFVITQDGKVKEIECNTKKKIKMTLLRKYPFMGAQDFFNSRMDNGQFQGANEADFSDCVVLYTHKGITNELF